jgi:superfamily II DNA or RNA helicase
VPDPRRALRRRRRGARRLLQLRRRRPRRDLPPVTFVPYDGVLQWRSGDDLVESSFADAVSAREAGRRYRTAISLELADGLPRILAAAHERLEEVRAGGHRDAGGLVVAADGEHARAVARVLRETTGHKPTVVLHTEARAAEKLQAFTRSTDRWLVAVNMVSEGVDIPRLRVGVYATAAKTPLVFRQIVGRFVRTLPGRPLDRSWLFLPADPSLRAHAAEVERELRHVLHPPGEEEDGALDEVDARRETEGGEVQAFVPVAADVAPQLALFAGGPAPAPAPSFPSAIAEPDEATMPAFERARCCATSATGWWPTCGAAGRQPRRDQPLAEPLVRRAPCRGRVDRAARALDRLLLGRVSADGEYLSPTG